MEEAAAEEVVGLGVAVAEAEEGRGVAVVRPTVMVPPEGVLVAVTPDASVLLAGGLVALSSPKVHADQSICCPLDEVGAGVGVLVGAGVSVITVWKSCFPLLSRALPASTTRSGSI